MNNMDTIYKINIFYSKFQVTSLLKKKQQDETTEISVRTISSVYSYDLVDRILSQLQYLMAGYLQQNKVFKKITTGVKIAINSSKVNNLMANQLNQPKMLLKKSDHKSLLNQLKLNFLKLVDDVNMLDLSSLAVCLEYVFDKLSDCLQTYFSNLYTCIQILSEQTTLNHSRYVFQSKCTECQNGLLYNKIESMMNNMTLVDNNLNIKQMNRINKQINELSQNYEDIQLSLLIDEILLRKQSILNCKNPRLNNIYDQIAQYLENIPQSTINLNRENCNVHSSVKTTPLSQLNIGNFTEQIEFGQNFIQLLKSPIRKFIKRIFDYAKSIYSKKKSSQSISTQTLLIKDQQNIKMLLKNNQVLKKQLELLKKIKRQSEKDMVKLLDSQQKNEIRIVELTTQNSFLMQKVDKISSQLNSIKRKLQMTQTNKKEMSQKIVKDYTSEKAIFLKTIRQMEIKIQTTSHQLTRLRKQTQSAMISQQVQTDQCISCTVQVQTEEKFYQFQSNSLSNNEGEIRFSSNHSRKNVINKFANYIRKSDNNEVQSPEACPQMHILLEQQYYQDKIIDKHPDEKRIQNKRHNYNGKQKMKPRVQEKRDETCNQIQNWQNFEEVQEKGLKKKRQSIIQKMDNTKQIDYLPTNSELFMRGQRKKITQTFTNINKPPLKQPGTYSQFNLRIQQKCFSKQSDFKQSDLKNLSINGIRSWSRNKLQSSRMFLKKQNCSPYIGLYSSSSFANMQRNGDEWLQQLEIKNIKREGDWQMYLKRQSENSEKIKFISKLMERYKLLKEAGLLAKINQIVSLNQLDNEENQQNQLKILHQESIKMTQRSQYKKKQLLNGKQKQANGSQIRSIKIQTFSENQLIVLFVSVENAKKYELVKDIWKRLNNSIMLDYKFMYLCDQVQIYFTNLSQQDSIFYEQLCYFLDKPYKYLMQKKKNQKIINFKIKNELNQNKRCGKDIKKHYKHNKQVSSLESQKKRIGYSKGLIFSQSENEQKKYLNAIITPNIIQKSERIKSSHQLRQIIHQLLRYHKVIHRKCNHVEEFLSLIGFKNNS